MVVHPGINAMAPHVALGSSPKQLNTRWDAPRRRDCSVVCCGYCYCWCFFYCCCWVDVFFKQLLLLLLKGYCYYCHCYSSGYCKQQLLLLSCCLAVVLVFVMVVVVVASAPLLEWGTDSPQEWIPFSSPVSRSSSDWSSTINRITLRMYIQWIYTSLDMCVCLLMLHIYSIYIHM